ncbi:MAG: hypothetical protein VKI83_07030 [Synechococcaceae cyanobacterium]|nr:hypothetical protein [Synechococcaceae cyanobacterium]
MSPRWRVSGDTSARPPPPAASILEAVMRLTRGGIARPSQTAMSPETTDLQVLRERVETFRQAVAADELLQRQLRGTTTAAGLAEVAAAAGVSIDPAALVKDFARRLLEADDEITVRNFDNCGWDQGELAWLLKTWQ